MFVYQERLAQLSIAVLLMYVMIFSNGMKAIVGCNIRHALSHNVIMQHLTAFIILLFFIVITTKETNQGAFGKNVVFSILVYAWFAMLTRVRVITFLLVLVLLLIAYAIGKFGQDARYNDVDQALQAKHRNIQYYQALLTIVAALITTVSFVQYIHDKKMRYGDSFRWRKFFSEPPRCKACAMVGRNKCV